MQAGKVYIITQDAEGGAPVTDEDFPIALWRPNSIGERVVTTGETVSNEFHGELFEVEFSDASVRWVKPGNVVEADEADVPTLKVVENSDDYDDEEAVEALTTTMKLAVYNGDAALFTIPHVDTLDSVILSGSAFEALGRPEFINIAVTAGCSDCADEAALEEVA